jgi:hypothetical protein
MKETNEGIWGKYVGNNYRKRISKIKHCEQK